MNARTLLAVAVAASVLLAGMAAAGAATPAEPANDNAPDEADRGGEDRAADHDDDAASNETDAAMPRERPENASDAVADRGPPSEMPEQAADHVSEIHDTIDSFLNDEVDNLGDALSGLLGGDGEQAEDEQADADTPAQAAA